MLLASSARCAANIIKAPFATLRALKSLFVGPAVLVSLALIYLMTSPGHWWVQWAALGIGIAWVVSLLHVPRAAVLVGGLAALIVYLRRR